MSSYHADLCWYGTQVVRCEDPIRSGDRLLWQASSSPGASSQLMLDSWKGKEEALAWLKDPKVETAAEGVVKGDGIIQGHAWCGR